MRSFRRPTLFATACLGLCSSIVAAGEPIILGEPPTAEKPVDAGIISAPDGAVEVYFLRDGERTREIACARTIDHGRNWSPPRMVLELPGEKVGSFQAGQWFIVRPFIAKDGEIHLFLLRVREPGGRRGVDQSVDLWYVGSREGRTRWHGPSVIYKGAVGPPRSVIQLSSGRILCPFEHTLGDRDNHYPTGTGEIRCVYSDDGGDTWQLSPSMLTTPVDRVDRGGNYGAGEPAVIALADGRIWMLLRTSVGRLYQSFSRDGVEWTRPEPSRFSSSNSPAALVRMRDGRIVLMWNNSQDAPAIDGSQPYTNRDVLHAAISADEGKNWRGYREVLRSARRNENPPTQGTSYGTAYPDAAVTPDGKLLVMAGHGEGCAKIVLLDPAWLLETSAADDFADGLDRWCIYKGIGPIETFWRARVAGASLVAAPGRQAAKALQVRRPKGQPADGAVWNFPMGRRGSLKIDLRLQPGFAGASIALGDRYYDPTDIAGERQSLFDLRISAYRQMMSGPALETDRWHAIEMKWDVDKGRCHVSVDGKEAVKLEQVSSGGSGPCYLRLRSTAQSPEEGFLVARVRVEIDNATIR